MTTAPLWSDRLGTIGARLGAIRNTYLVAPGIYGVGNPQADSPLLVTANYKLSFDQLRFQLAGIDAWILVIDTRGINVWCAAGKNTFSTAELVYSLDHYQLSRLLSRRRLIVPQLSAPALCAEEVRRQSGFRVIFGPVRAADLPRFLAQGEVADEEMRTVTFSWQERAVLIPVEFFLVLKPLAAILISCLLISGLGPGFFSLEAVLSRGPLLLITTLAAICSGTVLVPLLLPWLPGRQFWLKGLLPGLLSGGLCWLFAAPLAVVEGLALLFWSLSIASFLAMNFTGSTPFTSPSGVEYEMKRGLVVQFALTGLALTLWLLAPFL